MDLKSIDGPFEVDGPGGPIPFLPFKVNHGSIDSLGFRMGNLAYLPDVSEMTDEAWAAIEGADTWVVDALRYKPHPTHTHVEQTLQWIARSGVREGVLTNMHVDVDHATIAAETPPNVSPAHDGRVLAFEV